MPAATTRHRLAAFAWALLAVAVVLAAWALPVHLKSVTPVLLGAAGAGTPSAADLGQHLLRDEKPGPAALLLQAARSFEDLDAPDLATDLATFAQRRPEFMPWGGWDPFLEPLSRQPEVAQRDPASTPVLTFFVTQRARATLLGFLSNSRSQAVLTLLRTREIDRTARFAPATRAGGQALDAMILLSALLHQGGHLSTPLQRELRTLADSALAADDLSGLEPFFTDLLALGRRLDWTQLTTLLARTERLDTVADLAGLFRNRPADLPLLYTAILMDGSADRVATYLRTYGEESLPDLRLATSLGQGALQLLLLRNVPVNHQPAPDTGELATLALMHPHAALGLKWFGWFLGAFALLRALDRATFGPGRQRTSRPHLTSGALAIVVAAIVIVATEPFLVRPRPVSDLQIRLAVPVLASVSDPSSLTETSPTFAMDTNSLLSIGFFAALQLAVYLICLMKIRQIDALPLAPLVKLRLMENEENLFDGGLYVGIGGTAAALVLQVVGVIDPNLLAAYSSNLFGITCVALVKIRHVRPYKTKLIMEGQAEITAAATAISTAKVAKSHEGANL